MAHQVLALKWRPKNFSEVVGQPHVVTALTNGLENNRLHHAFLFTGTRGVGKTTLARIFAKSLNCEEGVSSTPCGVCSICKEVDSGRFVDLIEIDAASRTKVEDTREILDNVQYAPTRGRYKVYLIDEVHMLSQSSFNALLKTLEEPPAHVKFLLATTDPQKLPITVLSRCLRFQLRKIDRATIKAQLQNLLEKEMIHYDESALALIAQAGEGSMRDALSILDQAIAYTGGDIQYEPTRDMLGLIDTQYIIRLLAALSSEKSDELLSEVRALSELGVDYTRLLEELIEALHELSILKINSNFSRREGDELAQYRALAERFSSENLQLYYQIALHGRNDLSLHPNSELGFEMTLMRMLLFTPNLQGMQKKNSVPVEEEKRSEPKPTAEVTREVAEPLEELPPWDLEDGANDLVLSDEDLNQHIPSSSAEEESLPLFEPQDSLAPLEAEEPELPLQSEKKLLESNEDWLLLAPELPFSVVVGGIARSLVFQSREENHIIFQRSNDDRVFDIDDAEKQISEALSRYYQQSLSVTIEYQQEALQEEHYYARQERLEQEAIDEAHNRLKQDEVVLYLEEEWGARLRHERITLT